MITIIYGEDIAASRNYYIAEREKHKEKIILEGSTLTLTDFLQATSNNGLFGDQQAIFIEELLSKRKPSKELEALVSQIASTSQTPLYLYESKEITAKQLSPFKEATIKQFKIPASVFAFLDSLTPKNGQKSLQLFHDLLQQEDAAFALFMLQRQARILLSLSSEQSQSNVISELKRMAPWQKGKMQRQAKAFSPSQLTQLHESLYQLELAQKTGNLSQPLDQAIDFLLLSL